MGLGLCVGAVFLGTLAIRLRQRGIGADKLFAIVAALFVGAEIVLITPLPVPSLLHWFVVSVVGAATVLSYAISSVQRYSNKFNWSSEIRLSEAFGRPESS